MGELLDPPHQRHIEALREAPVLVDEVGMRIDGEYVMFFVERDLMRLHAEALMDGIEDADVLEVGLGLGVFAEQVALLGIRSYTCVEPHQGVIEEIWPKVTAVQGIRVSLHANPWQLAQVPAGSFDAIMYDTLPPEGCDDRDFTLFVEHFALSALRPGGRFSFFSEGSEISPARRHVMSAKFRSWSTGRYRLPANRIPPGWTLGTQDFCIPVAVKDG